MAKPTFDVSKFNLDGLSENEQENLRWMVAKCPEIVVNQLIGLVAIARKETAQAQQEAHESAMRGIAVSIELDQERRRRMKLERDIELQAANKPVDEVSSPRGPEAR